MSNNEVDWPIGSEENLERQNNEVSLLQSMYLHEIRVLQTPSAPQTEYELEVAIDSTKMLICTLPRAYPSSSRPRVFLSFSPHFCSNEMRNTLRHILHQIVDKIPQGVECIDLIIGEFREKSSLVHEPTQISRKESKDGKENYKVEEAGETARMESETAGSRVVLWMHHLLATNKRRAIVRTSRELGLVGFSKPGYPGAIYVEGTTENVKVFVNELKSMRWQAIQVRVWQEVSIAELKLPAASEAGIQEVEGLSDISEKLKTSSGPEVAAIFLEGMKIK